MHESAGPAFQKTYDARGLAVGDYDNDGDADVIFTCLQDRPVLLRNNIGQENAWLGLELEGTLSNRDAIGAKLTLLRQGEAPLVRWITGGSSIFSSQDKRVIFGLGSRSLPGGVTVEIRWPSGERQRLAGLQPNRYHLIVEPQRPREAALSRAGGVVGRNSGGS